MLLCSLTDGEHSIISEQWSWWAAAPNVAGPGHIGCWCWCLPCSEDRRIDWLLWTPRPGSTRQFIIAATCSQVMYVQGELSCLCLSKSKKCADAETNKICNTCSNIFSLHCRETTFIQIDIDSDAILLPGSEQVSIENLLSGNIVYWETHRFVIVRRQWKRQNGEM